MTMADIEEFEAIEIVSQTAEEEAEGRKHIFTIDGRKYFVPLKVPFRVTLRATKIYATASAAQAEAYMLTQFLGEDSYDALCNSSVTKEQFEAITDLASKVVLGKGKVRETAVSAATRGRKKSSGS